MFKGMIAAALITVTASVGAASLSNFQQEAVQQGIHQERDTVLVQLYHRVSFERMRIEHAKTDDDKAKVRCIAAVDIYDTYRDQQAVLDPELGLEHIDGLSLCK